MPAGPFDSAHFATWKEIHTSGMLTADGLYTGVTYPHWWREWYLRTPTESHVLAFAPTRGGKTSSIVALNALSPSQFLESLLAADYKLEAWHFSAGYRKSLGHHVLLFAPTLRDGRSARYNFLHNLSPWPDDVAGAERLAEILVDPEGKGVLDYWHTAAKPVLQLAILATLYGEEDKHLGRCLTLLSDPARPIVATLNLFLNAIHDPQQQFGWRDETTGLPTCTHPRISTIARMLLDKSENERSGVISTAIACLQFLLDPTIVSNTSPAVSDFSILDLVNAEQPVSLYVHIPFSDLERCLPLLRIFVSQLLHTLLEKLDFDENRGVSPYRHTLRLLFDEFARLGNIPFMESALSVMAGFGLQAVIIVQDVQQIVKLYGPHESLISNCDVRVVLGPPNRIETAKLIADLLGTQTVRQTKRTFTGNRFAFLLGQVHEHEEERKLPLLDPSQLMQLSKDKALVLPAGHPPILGNKAPYFLDRVFLGRSKIPPPPESDRLPQPPWPFATFTPASAVPDIQLADEESAVEEPAVTETPTETEQKDFI